MKLLLENWREYLKEDQELISLLIRAPAEQAVELIRSQEIAKDEKIKLIYDYFDAIEDEFNKAINSDEEMENFWRDNRARAFELLDSISADEIV